MKYSIFYLIKGEHGKYVQKLIYEAGPKFGEDYMIKNPLPPHIVLKYPFETKNIKKIEKVLKEFAKKQKQSKIQINGFGNFRKFVVFLKTKFSKQALKTQKELIKQLQKIGINSHEFDKKFKPHTTIAYGNTKKSFKGIWNFLKNGDKPKFNLKLNNIAIMKEGKKYWRVYKEFKILSVLN